MEEDFLFSPLDQTIYKLHVVIRVVDSGEIKEKNEREE